MVISQMVFPVNHLTGTSKTKSNYNQIHLTQKTYTTCENYKHTHELNQMKLKPGLGASYAIRPGNGVGLFYSSRTHTT